MLVKLSAEALLAAGGSRDGLSALVMINGSVALYNAVYQLLGNFYSVGNLCRDDFLSVKARHFNGVVSSNDTSVTRITFLVCENVFRAARAVCLNLNRNSELFARLFESLSRHISMCNSRRTSRHRKHFIR